MSLQVR